jgi:ADP-heptose:LPS heptosyltransferase
MRFLIVNLTRMGDLLQTLPLVNGLRERHPGAEIDYLAMRGFSGILKFFPGISEVFLLDEELLVTHCGERPWDAYRHLDEVLKRLSERKYDLVVSPVASIQASILCYLIPAAQKRGMLLNGERRQEIAGEWTAFHLANEHNLGDRTFNLVDIFARTGGVKAGEFRLAASPEADARAERFFESRRTLPVVGFHIGASRDNKAWEPEKFREVIVRTLDRARVILFGGTAEEPLKPFFADIRHPNFDNLIGAFGLDDLVAHVGRVDLFVTNDTGPMHIAAATGRRILNLSLGPVSLWETGPWPEGAVVLQADIDCHPCKFDHECGHLDCHRCITPEIVLEHLNALLDGSAAADRPGVLAWRIRRDIYGLHHAAPLNRRAISPREWVFECKRAVWGMSLAGDSDPTSDWGARYLEYLKTLYEIPRIDIGPWLAALESQCSMLEPMIAALEQLGRGEKSIDRIKSTWESIKGMKAQLLAQARDFSLDFDFFYFAEFKESHLRGEGVKELARQTAGIYRTTGLQIAVLVRMLRSAQ